MSFANKVITWYEKNGRKFPWRSVNDPYKILITEILLQRTKAEQVKDIWYDFFYKFPNVSKLSKVKIKDIKSEIKSLGLIGRANKIKDLSATIINNYNGKIPQNDDIFKLPGVGDYIGNAVLCFAFGKKRVLIDSNIVLVISIIHEINYSGEGRRSKDIRKKVKKLLPDNDFKKFYFGLIDLGDELRKKDNKERIISQLRIREISKTNKR